MITHSNYHSCWQHHVPSSLFDHPHRLCSVGEQFAAAVSLRLGCNHLIDSLRSVFLVLSDAVQRLGHVLSLARLQIEYNGCDLVHSSGAVARGTCGGGGGSGLLRCLLLSVLVEGDVADDATQGNSLALISQRESAESAAIGDFLDGNSVLHADSNQALGE